MKNLRKVLALVLAVATLMSFAAMATAADFSDAKEISKDEAVTVLTELGVINGMGDGTFDAKGSVTRAQMATMISKILNSGKDIGDLYASSCTFTDMDAAKWAKGYVAYCANKGIINGRDAKTFDPNGLVTATEAAKMILCALGYDANNEGLTGDAWAANTVNLATDEMNLFKGVGSGLDAAINRETAAQMLLNGLLTDMVKYEGGSKLEVNGVTFITGADLKPAGKTLVGKYFPKAERETGYYDNFGRPGVIWTDENGVELDPIIAEPVLTGWGLMTAGKIYAAVGVKGEDIATILVDESDMVPGQTQHCRFNGKAMKYLPKMGSGSENDDAAWGTVNTYNEVYYDEDTNTLVYLAFLARLGVVTEVKDKVATVVCWYNSTKGTWTVPTTTLKKGDVVLGYGSDGRYTEAKNSYNNQKGYTAWDGIPLNADEPMFEYVIPEYKTVVSEGGIQTAGCYTTLYTDMGTYSDGNGQFGSSVKSAVASFTAGEEYNLYFNGIGQVAGYIAVEEEKVDEEIKYAYVLDSTTIEGVAKPWPETGKTADTHKAQVLFADGSVEIVITDKKYAKDTLYTYTVNSKGQYVLKSGADVENDGTIDTVDVVNGKATVSGDLYANSKTTFVVQSKDKKSYTVYTGIKAVPTMKGAKVAYIAKDNKISLAFVLGGTPDSSTATAVDTSLIYLAAKPDVVHKDGKSYAQIKVILEGSVKTMKFDTKLINDLTDDGKTTVGLKVLIDYETNADGYISKMTLGNVADLGVSLKVGVMKTVTSGSTTTKVFYEDGVMNLNINGKGLQKVTVDETVKAYIYGSTAEAVKVVTIDKLTEKFSGVAVMDGEKIVAIYGTDAL